VSYLECRYAVSRYPYCLYAKGHYAECLHAEYHYAECRGACPAVNISKLFCLITDVQNKLVKVIVPGGPFQPCPIFVVKSGAPERSLPKNIVLL
jgi:hypothetical protein